MVDVNPTSPADDSLLSAYPADEQASRAALVSLLNGKAFWGGVTGGSANAQTATVDHEDFAVQDGTVVIVEAGFANTLQWTLNVNGTGAATVYPPDTDQILDAVNQVVAGGRYVFLRQSTRWHLMNPADYMSQTEYDRRYPVGKVELFAADVLPNELLPLGVAAVWVEITTSGGPRVLALHSAGTAGAAAGSETTGAGSAHTHGAGSYSANVGSRSGTAGPITSGEAGAANVSGTSGSESSHTHPVDPFRYVVRAWRRDS